MGGSSGVKKPTKGEEELKKLVYENEAECEACPCDEKTCDLRCEEGEG